MEVTALTWIVAIIGLLLIGLLGGLQLVAVVRPRGQWTIDNVYGGVIVNTDLWYGGADQTVPASAGRWLADRLPNSTYVLWPQHGHFTWMVGDEWRR